MNYPPRMRTALMTSILLLLAGAPSTPRGFSDETAASEVRWEDQYRGLLDPSVIRENDRVLSAEPHHLGSPGDEKNAQWILSRLREWGLDANIETFYVLFPTPKERIVELTAPRRFRALLAEPPIPGDATSSQTDRQLPTYNAYSIDGDVTAPLVYVNYGIPADYERLERFGIDVRGKIVIARYGQSWRGIKPKVAAEHGALGCILYSDPRDDGYFTGDVYPKGGFRPEQGVQRGSVADMPLYPGDPLTPGVGATRKPESWKLSDAKTLTRIPVLPISYGDARPLLAALEGPVAPAEWRGALPLTYHIGPGPAQVHLKLVFDWKIVPARDVIVRIPGSTWPDEWVIHGNHHDAWVNGAEDPISGQSALLEEARAFATLLKKGWRPKRTIVLCAWDGEEEGLFGSTEWVETHADELRQKAVAYINTDSTDRGFFVPAGSHTLEALVNEVAAGVEDPEKKISILRRARLRKIEAAKTADDRKEIRDRELLRIGALGSGSDYTPFLQHLGVASLNFSFETDDGGGVYHSIYDDFAWYTHFSDTDFSYGRALAQMSGTTLMRLADADILPFEFSALADTVNTYVKEVQKLAKDKREAAEELSRRIAEGLPDAVADARQPFVPPKPDPAVPFFDFSPLENGSAALTAAAKDYDAAFAKLREKGSAPLDSTRLAQLSRLLRDSERTLTRPEGLPRRPWFVHFLYAPGFYTGYDVKTLPAVRESIEEKQYSDVNQQVARTAEVIVRMASQIREATRILRGESVRSN
jgi:N-acetylated-alpha-linked acidic dipeptidase